MELRNEIKRILVTDYGSYDDHTIEKLLHLFGLMANLSFREIEMLVQLNHYDDSDFGNDEKRCAELIEETRNKIGYTKDDVTAYL